MYSAVAANKRNTIFIMLVFVVILAGLGWAASIYFGEPTVIFYVMIGASIYPSLQ